MNAALIPLTIGAWLGMCAPCDSGAIICPMLPTYDSDFEAENAAEIASLPQGTAIAQENDDYQKLRAVLILKCRSV